MLMYQVVGNKGLGLISNNATLKEFGLDNRFNEFECAMQMIKRRWVKKFYCYLFYEP